MTAMMRVWLAMAGLCGLMSVAAKAAPMPWEQPAAALAGQITGILGPGETRLTIRNLSSIPADEIPEIRTLLEADLKARGVSVSGAESPSIVRVTLSESARERLWVAEVVEGNETRVTMVDVGPIQTQRAMTEGGITLRRQAVISAQAPVLALMQTPGGLIVLEPEQMVLYAQSADGWHVERQVTVEPRAPLARDPRGILVADADGFKAWLPGTQCTGQLAPKDRTADRRAQCTASDDPWPVAGPVTWAATSSAIPAGPATLANPPTGSTAAAPSVKAFYNAARNYFTGVVTPSVGVDLPPFYAAAPLARSGSGTSLLIGGIDGKIQLAENGALRPIAGARDWGSDFAVLYSGCGAAEPIIASGSGEAVHDSLRAYELPALEAVPASAPLAMDGAVMALSTAPDGKSVFAVVRKSAEQYEVDRVTALCN